MIAPTAIHIWKILRTQPSSTRARRENAYRRVPGIADGQLIRAGTRLSTAKQGNKPYE